ncbi:dihydrolipoyl dehydrogenase [Candidatus Pacearchaeota archaeon]|nr:dihydrolipoyl dehydrogenase [Candidatus Pacearchaeota archaeon]
MEKKYDLIVVGGGTAGLRTSLYAAGHGHSTALIDPGILGGTCLNTGCIPTKAMLHASHLYSSIQNSRQFGIDASAKINFKVLMKRVHDIVQDGQDHISTSIQNKNLTLIKGKATFVSSDSVQVNGQTISGNKFIICTGAKARVAPIKGLENVKYMVSDDVLDLQVLPASIAVIGGGYIAAEFATFFSELGTKVYILERNPVILKDLDEDVIQLLSDHFTDKGISLITGSEIVEVGQEGNMKRVSYKIGSKSQSIKVEQLLIATGRSPNTFNLGLEKAGVKMGEKGNIEVEDTLQTSNKNIYAIGDVTGKAPFAHAAKRESHIALMNALDGKKEKMNFSLVPWAIFTEPPIGGVGMNEKQAKERNVNYGMLKANFSRAGRATVIGNTLGFAKVLYDKKTRKIIGSTIIGPKADELIHEFVALMNADAKIDILERIIHIHPTLSEVFEALKEV